MIYLWFLCSFLACQEAPSTDPVETEAQTMEAVEQILEKGGVSSTLRVWPKEPVLGDILHLELGVSVQDGWEVDMPPFGEALGRFQIIDFEPSEKTDSQNTRILTQKYRLQAHHSGKQQIPSLRLLIRPAEGEPQELLTDELTLSIASVLPADAPLELSPPRDKLEYFWSMPREAIVGGLLLLAASLGGGFWIWRRKITTEVVVSPFDNAIRQLHVLEEKRYLEDSLDQFYQELSMILRRYIEGRFGLSAPEQTTEEFLSTIKDMTVFDAEQKRFLGVFLRECDGVKFAGQSASLIDAQAALEKVRRFAQATKADEEAES